MSVSTPAGSRPVTCWKLLSRAFLIRSFPRGCRTSARIVGKLGVDERQPGAGRIAERAKEKRGLMFLCALPSLLWCVARRLVQAHGRPDQRPERILVDRFALVEVDCAPGVAIEARVEKA